MAQIEYLSVLARHLFSNLVILMCEWIWDEDFVFAYCDVLGARLSKIYELGGVREKAAATMAAFVMGCRHNRWFVMRKFVAMADSSISQNLADRLAVEFFTLAWRSLRYMEQIESEINVDRSILHPRIQNALSELAIRFN